MSGKRSEASSLQGTSLSIIQSTSKDSVHPTQLQTIFAYLAEINATASMASDATGVPQKNICRYKRDLEQEGRLWEITKATCKITGFKAWYLTCDETKAPNHSLQLKLF